ncbi:MAG: hypothetical protein JJU05_03630 [Verrucomicrobia bacterium]|nr:hypothetical protein [Verrucomicrobiota bacterium]MCH8526503.1 hypothetical protein [Kiritimatiellia bacterium]
MKKMFRYILPVLVVSLALGAGLFHQARVVGAMSRQLERLEGENRALTAERNGLREANADLMGHLERTRRLTANLPEPMMAPMSMRFAELPPVMEEEFIEMVELEEPDRELTPEEQAAREERLAEREARRAEWQARREEMRERVITEAQDRREFFEQVSLEGLAPEYVAGHQRLLEAMDEVQVRMAALSDPDLNREEQRDMRRELGQLGRELNGLMGMQREILLNDYAQAMGFQGADARVFIDSIETINEMTNARGLIWGGGRGRGGR